MGILDTLVGKNSQKKEQKVEEKIESSQGRYTEVCSLCNNPGTDKKWMGKYWHIKCMRSARKAARSMM